jgi:hypothetical protein
MPMLDPTWPRRHMEAYPMPMIDKTYVSVQSRVYKALSSCRTERNGDWGIVVSTIIKTDFREQHMCALVFQTENCTLIEVTCARQRGNDDT